MDNAQQGFFIRPIPNERAFTDALIERRLALGLNQDEVEHDIGLAQGHIGKLEHGGKTWGKLILRMTATATWVMQKYGICLVLMDQEVADRLLGPIAQKQVRSHRRKRMKVEEPSSHSLTMRLHRKPAAMPPE